MTATQQEKIQALKDMFGDEKAARILAQAESEEKEATELGIEAKEAKSDTPDPESTPTTKAFKKKKAPVKVEVEVEEDEEEEDMEDEEEVPEEEKDFDSETEPDDDYFPMGDIDVKEFGGLLAEAMLAGMQPVLDELITVKEAFTSVKEMLSSGDATSTKEASANQAAIKDAQSKIDLLSKQLAEVNKQLKELGAPPRSLAGLGATQDDSTTVKDGDPLLNSVPQADPLNDFAKFAIGANVPPGA